jgi:hypothetical protein
MLSIVKTKCEKEKVGNESRKRGCAGHVGNRGMLEGTIVNGMYVRVWTRSICMFAMCRTMFK